MKLMKLDESEIEYSKNNLKAFKTHLMLQLLHYTRLGYTIFCSFCCTIYIYAVHNAMFSTEALNNILHC